METLLHGEADAKQLAFLKLNRLVSGFLVTLQAWDHRDQWEDLRQTVLMKLVKSFCRGPLRESQAFVAYVRTITRNEFYDFLKARSSPAMEEAPEPVKQEPGNDETILTLRSALDHLPADQRRAIQAVYIEGRTYQEAAEATGIPLGSLKRYLRLGLGQLQVQLTGVLKGG
ncbi:MAG: RNA polymerase sigma factor [Deltaproteobacteria bacterium]|nr:RNA polymerase sigma factor [Deltaproteobacteria bacterium]